MFILENISSTILTRLINMNTYMLTNDISARELDYLGFIILAKLRIIRPIDYSNHLNLYNLGDYSYDYDEIKNINLLGNLNNIKYITPKNYNTVIKDTLLVYNTNNTKIFCNVELNIYYRDNPLYVFNQLLISLLYLYNYVHS